MLTPHYLPPFNTHRSNALYRINRIWVVHIFPRLLDDDPVIGLHCKAAATHLVIDGITHTMHCEADNRASLSRTEGGHHGTFH